MSSSHRTRQPSTATPASRSPRSAAPISANRTEVERFLPREPVIVDALHRALGQRRHVPASELANFYDDVLADLGVDPPDAWYPHVVARVHSIACTACPRFQWRHDKSSEDTGWVWSTTKRRASADTEDDPEDDL